MGQWGVCVVANLHVHARIVVYHVFCIGVRVPLRYPPLRVKRAFHAFPGVTGVTRGIPEICRLRVARVPGDPRGRGI